MIAAERDTPEVADRRTGGEKDLGVVLPTAPRFRRGRDGPGVEDDAGDADRKDDEGPG